jgi:hypothetical protein
VFTDRVEKRVGCGVRCEDDDPRRRRRFAEFFENFQPGFTRHPDVEKQELDPALPNAVERSYPVLYRFNRVSGCLEQMCPEFLDDRVVVGNKDQGIGL